MEVSFLPALKWSSSQQVNNQLRFWSSSLPNGASSALSCTNPSHTESQEVYVWSAGVIVYILLRGVPHFWAETKSGILKQILHGELDFVYEPWPNISDSAKDLVKQILDRDPNKRRISAHEVLCQPWIIDDKVVPDKPLDSA